MNDRDETIKAIKLALKKRSGKAWSVTGGRGTAWGWITIDCPPALRTFENRVKAGSLPGQEQYEEVDTGSPNGHCPPALRAELAKLLGLDSVHHQGVSIPSSGDYYREYLQRAQGLPVTKEAKPYWD